MTMMTIQAEDCLWPVGLQDQTVPSFFSPVLREQHVTSPAHAPLSGYSGKGRTGRPAALEL